MPHQVMNSLAPPLVRRGSCARQHNGPKKVLTPFSPDLKMSSSVESRGLVMLSFPLLTPLFSLPLDKNLHLEEIRISRLSIAHGHPH